MRRQSKFKELEWILHSHLELMLPQLDLQLEIHIKFFWYNIKWWTMSTKHIWPIPCVAVPGTSVCYRTIWRPWEYFGSPLCSCLLTVTTSREGEAGGNSERESPPHVFSQDHHQSQFGQENCCSEPKCLEQHFWNVLLLRKGHLW